MAAAAAAQPLEIGRANQHDLKIIWQDGAVSVYPARALRMACPCAGCVDEISGKIRLVDTSVPQQVYPVRVSLVGRYALTIEWSDGHHTGIYTFELLKRLASHG